jgi:hypothetical protein
MSKWDREELKTVIAPDGMYPLDLKRLLELPEVDIEDNVMAQFNFCSINHSYLRAMYYRDDRKFVACIPEPPTPVSTSSLYFERLTEAEEALVVEMLEHGGQLLMFLTGEWGEKIRAEGGIEPYILRRVKGTDWLDYKQPIDKGIEWGE